LPFELSSEIARSQPLVPFTANHGSKVPAITMVNKS